MEYSALTCYIHSGLSTRAIAAKYGVNQSSIRYWLKKFNLKTVSRSLEFSWDTELFMSLCDSEDSLHQVLIKMGKTPSNVSYKLAKNLANTLGINTPIYTAKGSLRLSDEDYFVGNTKRNNSRTKDLLLKSGISNTCSSCGISNFWNNKPLTLQLDHIDGNNLNNTKSNLRLLCPNCHTQTETYSRVKGTQYVE